ncbi:hypothetical protein TNCV_3125161 [Trichonephila clavipes]|nr:hypothetical protein TNCV_3125161 [Trichonephila clavipes]
MKIVFSVNGSETPKYERYSSPTTPSLGYRHHGFNSDCPKLLHGVGLYARRPMVCVRLTSRYRRDRREWATEHMNWRRN